MDTITGFTAGSSKDKLDVSAFTGSAATSGNVVKDGSGSGDMSDKVVLIDKESGVALDAAAAKAKFTAASSGSGSAYYVKDGQKLFFIDSASTDAASGDKLFYVEVVGTEITVTQVGVLGADGSGAWNEGNFA